jgi:hypothetical protein
MGRFTFYTLNPNPLEKNRTGKTLKEYPTLQLEAPNKNHNKSCPIKNTKNKKKKKSKKPQKNLKKKSQKKTNSHTLNP